MLGFAIAAITASGTSSGSYDASGRSPTKQRLRARVSYDGTRYKGWQFQANLPTIQATLEEAVCQKFGSKIRVVGASRTDSGVHARGQAMHFDVPLEKVPKDAAALQKLEFTMNQMLPQDVRIRRIGTAPPVRVPSNRPIDDDNDGTIMRPWHAIYCSEGKLYSYRFSVGNVLDPLQRHYRYYEWRAARFGFSEDLLRRATAKFVGSHDFAAFTNAAQMPEGITAPVLVNPVRTIRSADVINEGNGCYRIEFRIDGAMYRMIRNIMGTLLDVACGKMELSNIDLLFQSRDRRRVPKSAAAKGLCLEDVFYDDWDI